MTRKQNSPTPDYQTELREIRAMHDDDEGLLRFGRAWPVVKDLSEIEKELPYTTSPVESYTRRAKLLESLWDSYADTAREIGAPEPRKNLDVRIDRMQNAIHEIAAKITNPEEKRQARRAEKDRQEMDRLLKLPAPESVRRFIDLLTDTEAKVSTLRWGYGWEIARIARAMGRDRKTIKETLDRAAAKVEPRGPVTKTSRMIAAHKEARDIEDEMIERIDKEAQAKDTPHVVRRIKPQSL